MTSPFPSDQVTDGATSRKVLGLLAGLAIGVALEAVLWFVVLPAVGNLPIELLLYTNLFPLPLTAAVGAATQGAWGPRKMVVPLAVMLVLALIPLGLAGTVPVERELVRGHGKSVHEINGGIAVVERHGLVQRVIRLDAGCGWLPSDRAEWISPTEVRLHFTPGQGDTGTGMAIPTTAEPFTERYALRGGMC